MSFRKTISGVLAVALVLSMCGCDEGTPSSGNNPAAPSTTTSATTTTIDDDIENPVDVGDISITPADFDSVELETPVLKYMGNYDVTTAADIKPAWKLYEKTYAQKYYDAAADDYIYPDGAEKPIVVDVVAYDAIMDTLTARIQSDDSPDLVDKQANSFPYMMSKNCYEDLTPYMDMTAPQWAPLQQYIDRYEYNGKHYYYPWSYDVSPEWLYYDRGRFDNFDIPDPATQWENNEWTWDAFLAAMQQFVDKSEDERTLGVYGSFITDNFIASTGTCLIGTDETGKFVNNIKTPQVDRAVNWLESNLRRAGLSRLDFYSEYNNVSEVPVVKGLAAFQSMGGWKFTEYCKKFPESDIFLVPFPRDPEADEYYYRTSTFGYMVPKGAKNIQGACCFINCCRLSVTNEEMIETTKTSMLKSKKYSEEEYEFMMRFKKVEDFHVVLDENYCFDEITNAVLTDMLSDIAVDQSSEQSSWTKMVEENMPIINSAIDGFNALIE